MLLFTNDVLEKACAQSDGKGTNNYREQGAFHGKITLPLVEIPAKLAYFK